MAGLISIMHALQTSACYLRLSSTRTEVEQGRPLSRCIRRELLAAGATSGQKRACWEVRVVTPHSCGHFTFLQFSLRPADAPTPVTGGLCPPLCQKNLLMPSSSPQSLATGRRTQPGDLSQRDMNYVSWVSNKSSGTFRLSAVFAS